MQLHEIRYLLAVGQNGSFTKAAEACHVTQPALTRAVQRLEGELGGLLVSRERGKVHLTDLGRILEPGFREMIAQGDLAKRTASRFLRLDGAALTLGVMCTVGPMRFVGFLTHFRAVHPGIELTLVEGVPGRLAALLAEGEIDVAVMSDPDGFSDPLRAMPLYHERFVLACDLGHAFAGGDPIRMRQMEGQIYLQRINCEYRDKLADVLHAQGVEILRSHRSEREDWIQTMVVAGMGVCFLPEFTATIPGLALVPVTDPVVARDVCVVTVAGRRWSAPAAALVAALTQYDWPTVGTWDEAEAGPAPMEAE